MTLEKPWGDRQQAVIGRTPEQAAEGAVCIEALAVLFKPFVAEVLAPHIDGMPEEPTTREEVGRDIALLKIYEPQNLGEALRKPIDLARLAALWLWVGRDGRKMRVSAARRRQIHDEAARHYSHEIVRAWLQILHEEARAQGGVLMLWRLDDAMVPFETRSDIFYEVTPDEITGNIVLEILHRVRNALPDGREIPEAAERFLRAEGYEIRP